MTEIIFDYLKNNKINESKMINDLEINRKSFYNWKKNDNMPLKIFLQICEYLQISPNELLGYEEQNHPEEEEILLLKSRQIGKKNVKEIIDIMDAIIAIQNKKNDKEIKKICTFFIVRLLEKATVR